jgi:Arc/MetJ-type ribon-helix-helix transcriptional regulator
MLWYAGILKESINMTIRLPKELESSIEAAVQNGQFASVDDAMADAARLLLGHLKQPSPRAHAAVAASPDPVLGSIGALKEDADLLDEIVADAYRRRAARGALAEKRPSRKSCPLTGPPPSWRDGSTASWSEPASPSAWPIR